MDQQQELDNLIGRILDQYAEGAIYKEEAINMIILRLVDAGFIRVANPGEEVKSV